MGATESQQIKSRHIKTATTDLRQNWANYEDTMESL